METVDYLNSIWEAFFCNKPHITSQIKRNFFNLVSAFVGVSSPTKNPSHPNKKSNQDMYKNLFFNAYVNDNYVYIVTELEIIGICVFDYTLLQKFALPDYFERIDFSEKQAVVKCVNEELIIIKY